MFKNYIQNKLEGYVRQYFAAHPEIKLIVVAGSVGKTSTKTALATVLSQQYRVRMHPGNHNTELSAPLAILGIEYPRNIKSMSAWRQVFKQAKERIAQPATVDVIIQELGVDKPGDMAVFGRYLRPDIAVVTAVTPEHMEYFGTLDAVAAEELSVVNFSKVGVINRDDIASKYANLLTNISISTYGTTPQAEYSFVIEDFTVEDGYTGYFTSPELGDRLRVHVHVLGEHSLRPVSAAVCVAVRFGMNPQAIIRGIESLRPVSGRMNVLKGYNNSMIIDDTYNASPAAVASALATLATIRAPQKIAILGSMNELGDSTAQAHQAVGQQCQPSVAEWVITIGQAARQFIAPAAQANGCIVYSFDDAISAGSFVKSKLQPGAVVLAKGSQGNLYVEEAVKVLLRSSADTSKLVRQDGHWQEIKAHFFSKF